MKKPILVVDDPAETLRDLGTHLSAAGYAVTRLRNEDAIDALANSPPEIVLVQLYAGGGSGVTLAEQVRQRPDGAIVPIIFVGTGSEMVTSVSDALAVGGDYYFQHPLDMQKVIAKIRTYIGVGERAPMEDEQTLPNLPVPGFVSVGKEEKLEELDFFSDTTQPQGAAAAPLDDMAKLAQAEEEAKRRWIDEELRSQAEAESRLTDVAGAPAASSLSNDIDQTAAALGVSEPASAQLDLEAQAEEARRLEREKEAARKRALEEAALREQLADQEREKEAVRAAEEALRKKVEAETKARLEAEAKVKIEAETKARLEAEAKAKIEAETKARIEAEAKAKLEAETKARLEAEAKAKIEAEILARRQQEELARLRAEEDAARKRAELEAERRRAEEEVNKRRALEDEARRRVEADDARRRAAAAEDERRAREERQRALEDSQSKERQQVEMQRIVEATVRERLEGEVQKSLTKTNLGPDAGPDLTPGPPRPPASQDGSIDATNDVASICARFVGERITGKVRFKRGDEEKLVGFEDGRPLEVLSADPRDTLEEFLLKEHLLTRTQYQKCRLKQLQNPRQMGAFVVAEGFVKAAELFDVVRRHFEDTLHSLFEWEQGSYAYVAQPVSLEDRIVLPGSAERIVADGIRRRYMLPRLIEKIGGPSSLLVGKADLTAKLEPLGLEPKEKTIARLLDGAHSIEDLVFTSGLSEERIYQLLFVLVAFSLADVVVRGVAGASGVDERSVGIDRARIKDKYEQARRADYFEFLGLAMTATEFDIGRGIEAVRRLFAVQKFTAELAAELKEELAEIDRVLADAEYVLRDPRLRDAYIRHMQRARAS